jgi:mRNA interferase HicA
MGRDPRDLPTIKIQGYARKRANQEGRNAGKGEGITVRLDKKRGKGSHQTLYFGQRKTIIRNPKDELKTGTYHAMLKQLGISEKDLK